MCGAAAALYEHLRAMHLEHEGMTQKMEVDEINDILMVRQALTIVRAQCAEQENTAIPLDWRPCMLTCRIWHQDLIIIFLTNNFVLYLCGSMFDSLCGLRKPVRIVFSERGHKIEGVTQGSPWLWVKWNHSLSNEQWKKPWLVVSFQGLYYPVK